MSRVKFGKDLSHHSAVEIQPSRVDAQVWSDDARSVDLSECEISVRVINEAVQSLDADRFPGQSKRQEPWWYDAREVDLSKCEFPSYPELNFEKGANNIISLRRSTPYVLEKSSSS